MEPKENEIEDIYGLEVEAEASISSSRKIQIDRVNGLVNSIAKAPKRPRVE